MQLPLAKLMEKQTNKKKKPVQSSPFVSQQDSRYTVEDKLKVDVFSSFQIHIFV